MNMGWRMILSSVNENNIYYDGMGYCFDAIYSYIGSGTQHR